MKKYILLYRGPATKAEDMDPAKVKEVMGLWAEWMGRVGDAMVDMGQPMENGVSMVDDGTEGKALELSGYSIIRASDMSAAKKLVDNHPFLSDKSGKFSVEIFELLPLPGM